MNIPALIQCTEMCLRDRGTMIETPAAVLIADDLSSGALTIDPAAEDVHTFVEQTLTARIRCV